MDKLKEELSVKKSVQYLGEMLVSPMEQYLGSKLEHWRDSMMD